MGSTNIATIFSSTVISADHRTFPDLFETVLSHIETLPQPRRRKYQVVLCH